MELDNNEKRSRLFSPGMTDKNPAVKALFAFADGFVLAEGLGGGSGK
ncbi:hypothetical protein GJU41_06105 [Bacillus idriensis]|uniref:Uncharacterized protein n=1 Tax=Metabacillus idriensis TaxID=324768 RepID=A0A6I2M5X3_9BACI|nr:hypothetical protein [Metabacillus idriensis]MRX53538.1 hypothetical protein [Metabacillus idriensis]